MTQENQNHVCSLENEIWKPIKGYEGYYEISNLGRVKSIERFVKQGKLNRHVSEKLKSESINPYGYPTVTLCKDRRSRSYPIHRLIAEAFIPNPENKPQVDHINTNRKDYSLSNLRWVTSKENSNNEKTLAHCQQNTYTKEVSQRSNFTKKLRKTKTAPITVYQYSKDGNFIKEYQSSNDACRQTGISASAIRRVINDNTQSAGGYLWTSKLVDNIKYEHRPNSLSKHVLQFDKDGNFIKEWKSMNEAAKELGIYPANIYRSIKSNSKPRKYKFKFKE